jgi:hypothetical protein
VILAVDPSIASAGAALFSLQGAGRLVACARITMPTDTVVDDVVRWRRMAERIRFWAATAQGLNPAAIELYRGIVERIVCETPQIYQRGGGRTKGDPNKMLHMVGVNGALAGLFSSLPVTSYKPAEWKGQLPVDTLVRRVCSRLAPDELALVPMRKVRGKIVPDPDVGHAVGVGLHYLGRLEPVRVYPGASPG